MDIADEEKAKHYLPTSVTIDWYLCRIYIATFLPFMPENIDNQQQTNSDPENTTSLYFRVALHNLEHILM